MVDQSQSFLSASKVSCFQACCMWTVTACFLNCKPWGEVKINLSFTGDEPEWKTSKNEFSDSECANLKLVQNAGSLENCKDLCLDWRSLGWTGLEKSSCTAFNYADSSTSCVLRGCKMMPIIPPAQNRYPTFDGYWKSSASTGNFIESRSKNYLDL